MGGCFSQSKNKNDYNNERTNANYKNINESTIKVRAIEFSNIFSDLSCPIENKDMIESFNKISKRLNLSQINNESNTDWRKVSFGKNVNDIFWGACNWRSQQDKMLNGLGLLYWHEGKNQFLVGGRFLKSQLVKKQIYLKVLQKGAYYIGQLNNELSPHGQGELQTNQSQFYKGQFSNGVPHGLGERVSNDRKFKGKFKKGELIEGTQTTQKGSYQGNFKNNLKHGRGILRMNSGLTYEGQFENGKKNGEGILTKDKQIIYNGKWKQDKQFDSAKSI